MKVFEPRLPAYILFARKYNRSAFRHWVIAVHNGGWDQHAFDRSALQAKVCRKARTIAKGRNLGHDFHCPPASPAPRQLGQLHRSTP